MKFLMQSWWVDKQASYIIAAYSVFASVLVINAWRSWRRLRKAIRHLPEKSHHAS